MNRALAALADPTRRAFVQQLSRRARAAGELRPPRTMSQPAVSQHLRVLREAGLVRVERAGRRRIYHLEPAPLREVSAWIRTYEVFWNDRLDRLGAFLEEQDGP